MGRKDMSVRIIAANALVLKLQTIRILNTDAKAIL